MFTEFSNKEVSANAILILWVGLKPVESMEEENAGFQKLQSTGLRRGRRARTPVYLMKEEMRRGTFETSDIKW